MELHNDACLLCANCKKVATKNVLDAAIGGKLRFHKKSFTVILNVSDQIGQLINLVVRSLMIQKLVESIR